MKKIVFNIAFLFLACAIYSQNASMVNMPESKKERAIYYNDKADIFLDSDILLAKVYTDSALEIAKAENLLKIISDSYVNFANINFIRGDLDSAFYWFNRSYFEVLKSRNRRDIAAALNRLGLITQALGEYNTAAEYFFKSLNIYDKLSDHNGMADIYNNLGIIYENMGRKQESINYYNKALELYIKTNNDLGQANIYNNLTTHFANDKEVDTALVLNRKTISIFNANNRRYDAATAYYNAAILFEMKNFSDSAQLFLDSALLIYQQVESKHGIATVYSQQAILLQKNNQIAKAILLLEKSYKLRKETGNLNSEAQALRQLSEMYSKAGDFLNAYIYYRDYIALRDSIMSEKTTNAIDELNVKYETEKKESQIEILKKDSEIKQTYNRLFAVVIVAMLIILILLFYFFRIKSKMLINNKKLYEQQDYLSRLEIEKREAEQKQLEKEIELQKETALLNEIKHKNELEHQARELATSTMHLLTKNKILADISDSLSMLSLSNNENHKQVKQIIRKIDSNINLDSDWEQFKIHFEKVNTGFFENLQTKYPELSSGDLKVCAYLKINLSVKEIAQMLNISQEGINKRLYRIRKKMELPLNSNIPKYLSEI